MTERASAALSKGTPAADPLIGRVIGGRFNVTALIARGGMGKVYRAEQAPLGRACALKVLNASYAGGQDPEFHRRFFLEASIASKLTHPNTVTIFDYGRTDDEIYYMAMEYLEGRTLHRAIRDAGQLVEERAAHIARQICRALREAHSLGAIHRDLKPANVFLVQHGDEADFVKVLDFGLVKNVVDKGDDLTQTGMFMGSPKYMAPEQIRGDRVDARTDVYALGIILYEMLTGKVPFDRPTSVNILMAHVHEDALPMRQMNSSVSISSAMEAAVAGCMAKDPERRFRSMDEVLAALKRVGESASGTSFSPASVTGSAPPRWGVAESAARESRPSGTPPSAAPKEVPSGSPGPKSVLGLAVGLAVVASSAIAYVALRPARSSEPIAASSGATAPIAPTSASASAADRGATAPTSASASAADRGATALIAPTSASASAAERADVPAAAPARVRVSTDPDGATVKEDGIEVCSSTPCDIFYKGADAVSERDHKLTLARQGYRVELRSVKATDPVLSVKLTPLPRVAAPQPARPVDAPVVPKGYKTDLPY